MLDYDALNILIQFSLAFIIFLILFLVILFVILLCHFSDKWAKDEKNRFKQDVKDIIDSYGRPKHED